MINAYVYLVKYFLEHGLDFSGTAHICLEWNANGSFIACSYFNFLANLIQIKMSYLVEDRDSYEK